MAKPKRGLPDSFSLNVTQDEPAGWGDYVEEEMTPRRTPPAEPTNVVAMPAPAERQAEPPPSPAARVAPEPRGTERLGTERLREELPEEPFAASRQRRREPVPKPVRQLQRPARVQLNITPDTQRMLETLLDDVQTYSAEKKTGMADVYEALILAAYEAREECDFSKIRPRGRWGTPTAAAFRVELKNALQRGIAARVQKER